jgi:hypothetical protein
MDHDIQWSNWSSLGKPQETEIGRPFVQRNQDGRLEVFAIGSGGIFNIWHYFQTAVGKMTGSTWVDRH